MGITDLVTSLGDNPYFGAGFGLFGLGVGTAILRKTSQFGMIVFRRHFMMTLEVPIRDASYPWLLQWLTVKGARQFQHLSVNTYCHEHDSGSVTTKFDFLPSVDTHFFW